jgi:membrane fusion protein (multidrug efflux system)
MLRKTFLALAVVSALAACNKNGKGPESKAGASASASAAALAPFLLAPEDLMAVRSSAVASGPVITGSIQPERRADLRAEVPAVVLQVVKDNGEHVRRGDLLVRLDDTAIRDSLMSAEASARAAAQSYDQAQRQLERLKTLRASGMTSMQALDEAEVRRNNAQSEVSAAKSRAATARQQMARTAVRAPFDGVVSDRKVSNGDTAQIGKELIKVIDPSSLRFEGFVPADKIAAVKVGQEVSFSINGYPGQVFTGKISRIDPAANPTTRQVAVMASFAGGKLPAVAGLYAEGTVAATSTDGLMRAGSLGGPRRRRGQRLARQERHDAESHRHARRTRHPPRRIRRHQGARRRRPDRPQSRLDAEGRPESRAGRRHQTDRAGRRRRRRSAQGCRTWHRRQS